MMKKSLMIPLLAITLLTSAALAQQPAPGTQPADSPAPAVSKDQAMDQLETAYQKEYAFLEAQLRDLRQQRAEFEAEAARSMNERQAQIDRAEGEWIGLQSRAERLQNMLADAERQLETIDDARSTLEATFLQAGSTLEPFGIDALQSEVYLGAPDGERIDTLFSEALNLLARISKVRETPGAYFLADGTEVQGRILRVGNVMAYGYSEQGGGALAPAGEGRLKVWPGADRDTAASLATGSLPSSLGVFLFESESRAVEEQSDKTLLSVINSGGTIAWIIVALGLFGGILIVARLVFLRNASAATGKIVERVGRHVRKGEIDKALATCKEFQGATARVVAAAVRNLDRDRVHLEDIISESLLHESSHLNRFGSIILVIAAVAPLLGLLGTVTGMITTFDIITEFGTGDPKLLSGGISIALVTTEVGLAVAIPTLLLGNVLSSWAENIKGGMEKGALRVINQYKEHRRTA